MKLVIMRHAEAVSGNFDQNRPLTSKGQQDANKIGQLLAQTGWQWAFVRSSPVERAKQTAAILTGILNCKHEIAPYLSPGVSPVQFENSLGDDIGSKAMVCVFHMPDIAQVAGYILGADSSRFYLPPGSALAINLAHNQVTEALQIFHYQPDFIE